MTSRRDVLLLCAAVSLGSPLRSFAQQQKVQRVGFLTNDPDPRRTSPTLKALLASLHELGWIEGKNIELRLRSSGGRIELFPQLAAELVREQVDVIVASGSAATQAAKAASGNIPIVFASATDPVKQDLVGSLTRPGGNVTGVALAVQELGPKRLQLVAELLPRGKRFVRLYHPGSIAPVQPGIIRRDDSAARELGVALEHVYVKDMPDVESALATAARNRVDGVILTGAGLFVANREAIAKLALTHRLPAMCADGRFTDAGALASYGEDFALLYRRAGAVVDKILRGTKPANIPVTQPAVFELVLNLKTAKALGVSIPEAVLLQADRVVK